MPLQRDSYSNAGKWIYIIVTILGKLTPDYFLKAQFQILFYLA